MKERCEYCNKFGDYRARRITAKDYVDPGKEPTVFAIYVRGGRRYLHCAASSRGGAITPPIIQ